MTHKQLVEELRGESECAYVSERIGALPRLALEAANVIESLSSELEDKQLCRDGFWYCQVAEKLIAARPKMIPAGWRYRDTQTGIVTLTEQPPDRVSNLDQFEVSQLFANDPLDSAARDPLDNVEAK